MSRPTFRLPSWRRPAIVALTLAAGLVLSATLALAHAYLERSTPAGGSKLSVIPQTVCLSFGEPVEKGFSIFAVKDSRGNRVDDEAKMRQAKDRFGSSKIIAIPLKELTEGSYTVEWKVLSVDSHVTEGRFTFTVLPGAKPAQADDKSRGDETSACAQALAANSR